MRVIVEIARHEEVFVSDRRREAAIKRWCGSSSNWPIELIDKKAAYNGRVYRQGLSADGRRLEAERRSRSRSRLGSLGPKGSKG